MKPRRTLELELRGLLLAWKVDEAEMTAEERKHTSDTLPAAFARGAVQALRRCQANLEELLDL